MRKIFALLIAAVLLALIVSCSTTQASDVEPVVREVKVSEFTTKEYTADKVYQMLERFVKDTYEDDKELKVTKDAEAKTILIQGYELDSNVGALAQDGYIVMDIKFEAKDDKAVFSLIFVDSYTYMQIGPLKKKTSQGITELGLKELDYQAQYIADHFQAALASYAYYVDNGLI